jgi:hypothetical protein
MSEWANKYGPLYKLHFMDACVLVCTDPETNARITRRTGAATDRDKSTHHAQFNKLPMTCHRLTGAAHEWCIHFHPSVQHSD